MPKVNGNIVFTDTGDFIASFTIDGIVYVLRGHHHNIEPFSCKKAVLNYGNVDQLTHYRPITATVGRTIVDIHLDNGPNIYGFLDKPINWTVTVQATIGWQSHKEAEVRSFVVAADGGLKSCQAAEHQSTFTPLTDDHPAH